MPKINKTKKSKKLSKSEKIKFTEMESKNPKNINDIVAETRSNLTGSMTDSPLRKTVKPLIIKKDKFKKYDRNKITFSSKMYDQSYDGIDLKGYQRLSDQELRQISQLDPYISAIISTRCSQAAIIGRPSDSKFDKGTRLLDLDQKTEDDFDSQEMYEKYQQIKHFKADSILKWVMHCGTSDKEVIDYLFVNSDHDFKYCSFSDFISSQVRNLLTFGRCATQIFRNADGHIIAFRPAPVETIYNQKPGREVHLSHAEETSTQSIADSEEYNQIPDINKPQAYVQKAEGQIINFFTEDDMKISYFQRQALWDLRSYPLSPIEQALYMVFIHQNTLQYLRNQFVKGLGTKGILSLRASESGVALSNEDLDELRNSFHNFLTRTDNSATTPVISGPVDVSWIPLTANPRDMEFLQVEEHVIRALCSAFQISPQEMGYGHLSMNQGSLTAANKQEEIIRGEERGLRMVLDTVFDLLNDILYENFPDAEKNFRITYTGVGEDTRETVISRSLQELNTTATMSSLWADSEKNEPLPIGGNVPLASVFHQNVVRYMKYGEFMEMFFGKEGWSDAEKYPEYDFIIDPNLNQTYQQLRVNTIEMQTESADLQLKTQEMQTEAMAQQNEMMEQQQQMAMAQPQGQAQGQSQEPQEGQQPTEDAQKSMSLREVYRNKKLNKSVSYFEAWEKIVKS